MSLVAYLTVLTIVCALFGLGFCLATWLGIRQTEKKLKEWRAQR
jgi:uncharacterized protein YneF (UPF0154 family)